MSKLIVAVFVTAALSLGGCATQRDASMATTRPTAPPVPISKEAYDTAVRNAETQYKIDKDACGARSGNVKDICLAEASGKEKIAKADARRQAAADKRDADYKVAAEKCDALSGSAKSTCISEAKLRYGKP